MRAAFTLALALSLAGCPPAASESAPPEATGTCAKFGQRCEVSPGKLGTCVQRDGCAPPEACFVCQSQH